MNHRLITAFVVILFSAVATSSLKGGLIASESFQTTSGGIGGTYDSEVNYLDEVGNEDVIVGNFGFSAGNQWTNRTSALQPTLSGLSHGTVSGGLQSGGLSLGNLNANTQQNFRNSNRNLAAATPASSSYFLSGLVQLTSDTSLGTGGGQLFMGVRPSTPLGLTSNDLNTGFHYGIRNDSTSQNEFLVAAAGGTVYDLVQIGPGTTYQVVMQLDVDPSGDDFLTAWYVPEGGTALTMGLTATNVGNIFQTTNDLNQLIGQVDTGPVLGDGLSGLWNTFDEVRFGTQLADVIPEPGSFLLLSGSGLALVLSRRRFCR